MKVVERASGVQRMQTVGRALRSEGPWSTSCSAPGSEPFATLYHWDMPQALQDEYGGWQGKDTARAFADYAGYVAEQLGDRVKHYFTINEFASFVEGGYQGLDVQVGGGKTVHLGAAPGLRLSDAELKQVRHHAVLGHGLAVQRSGPRARRALGSASRKIFASASRSWTPLSTSRPPRTPRATATPAS